VQQLSGVCGLQDFRNSGATLVKYLSRMIGAFEGVLLVVTTLVMAAPFLFAMLEPAARVVH
jgi:hypothetical protein